MVQEEAHSNKSVLEVKCWKNYKESKVTFLTNKTKFQHVEVDREEVAEVVTVTLMARMKTSLKRGS